MTLLPNTRILLSNDDGVYAPGLGVLEEIAHVLSDDVWVVAPDSQQSAQSHSVTTKHPLRMEQVAERKFAVDGTPTDAVLLGMHQVMEDKPPDLILSGINFGANMGDDITYSGTVAAAIEGTLLGVRSIALSQRIGDDRMNIHWDTAKKFAPEIIAKLVQQSWQDWTLMNINFPAADPDEVKGIKVCPSGRDKFKDVIVPCTDPRGRAYYWLGDIKRDINKPEPGSDVEAVMSNYVSVTPLNIDMTHYESLEHIKGLFDEPGQFKYATG